MEIKDYKICSECQNRRLYNHSYHHSVTDCTSEKKEEKNKQMSNGETANEDAYI